MSGSPVASGPSPIVVPYLGSAVHEVTIIGWHKAPGDAVKPGDVLCEIATDKVDTEIECTDAGILMEIVAQPEQTLAIGATIAFLAGPGGEQTIVRPEAPALDTAELALREYVSTGLALREDVSTVRIGAAQIRVPLGETVASPYARRQAADLDVELDAVRGSGAAGRIRAADVVASARPRQAPSAEEIGSRAFELSSPAHRSDLEPYVGLRARLVPTSPHRRATAEHMSRSVAAAPHAWVDMDVQLHRTADQLAEVNLGREGRGRTPLSYLPFIAQAAVQALRKHPTLNAVFDEDRIIEWDAINLGVAVDTPQGLVVPVIRNADALTAEALGDQFAKMAGDARARRLELSDLQAGTFTVTNLGGLGVASFGPILHQPQTAILGVPAVRMQPVVVDGLSDFTLAIRPVARLTLVFDHRAVDGAEAARFLSSMRSALEGGAEHQHTKRGS